MNQLPIVEVRSRLAEAMRDGNRAIVTGPTGSGKSTQVPQFLLDDALPDGRILVLQPRRLAARMLAWQVAEQRGTRPGGEVGFQTRFENATSASTRIFYITEGILLRMLQADRRLKAVSAVIFDEFHERNLFTDIGLAAVRELQDRGRPDLRIIVMSATLDPEPVQRFLGDCPILNGRGECYPVKISYLKKNPRGRIWDVAAKALREIIREEIRGDVLIFMPGAYHIRRTIEACKHSRLASYGKLALMPLFGSLSRDEQMKAMRPAQTRKIIVATNIAETSLTIPGVRHVIDSGLVKISGYDASRGFNTLNLTPISRASADQRSGRSGREAPGTCRRLWTALEQQSKPPRTVPEIKRVDLTETVLMIKSLGYDEIDLFPWFEKPDPDAMEAAVESLMRIGFVEHDGAALTELGRELARFPAHPRLALLIRLADRAGCFDEGILITAILSERPLPMGGKYQSRLRKRVPNTFVYRGPNRSGPGKGPSPGAEDGELQSDFFALINALREAESARFDRSVCNRLGINSDAARSVWKTYQYFLSKTRRTELGWNDREPHPEKLLKALLRVFPDRLAKRRDRGSLLCDLRNGTRGVLAKSSTVRDHDFLLVSEIRETTGKGRKEKPVLSLVSAVRESWLEELFPDQTEHVDRPVWLDRTREVVRRRRKSCLGVVVEQEDSPDVDPAEAAAILAEKLMDQKLVLHGWNRKVENWILRTRWVAEIFPEKELLEYDDTDLAVIYREICDGARRYRDVKKKNCLDIVRHVLPWSDIQFVEKMAPTFVTLPVGTRMRLQYNPGRQVRGKVHVQKLFGMKRTPVIAGGRARVLLEILAPNMTTIQITDDLTEFWKKHYPKARNRLAPRYTKHAWPVNPLRPDAS